MNTPEIQEYQRAFSRLNAEQKAAVLETEGPVCVVAGPGTGKTTVLSLRIGRILEIQDCHPSSILCLTFSRAAVDSIREKLQSLMGTTAAMVEVHTFHSFCHKLLRERGSDLLRNRKLISRAQQSMLLSRLLHSHLAESDPRHLKPAPATVINNYLNIFSHLTKEGIQLTELQFDHNEWSPAGIEFVEQLTALHQAYTGMLEERKLISFDDLLTETIRLLTDQPSLHAGVREKYAYLLVDEFQDTNPLQLQLIRLLTAGEAAPNLFATGDENQSIYRFQGAGTAQFTWLQETFEGVKTFRLQTNYRSNPGLAEAFSRIAGMITEQSFQQPAQEPAVAAGNTVENPILKGCIYRNSADEALGTAYLLQRLLQENTPGNIAVLARKHHELQALAGYLHLLGVPFRYNRQENNLLNRPFGLCLHYTLQFLHLRGLDNYSSEGYLFHALLYKQDGKKLLQLFMEQRQQTQVRFFEWLGAHVQKISYLGKWYALVQSLLWRIDEPLNQETLSILQAATCEGLQEGLSEPEEKAWKEWVEQFLETDKQKTLRSFAMMIGYQAQQHIPIPVPVFTDHETSTIVTLSTIHAAKGMGFSRVMLLGCSSTNWEDAPLPAAVPVPREVYQLIYPEATEKDDLTRLIYVACTRAEQELYCSFHEEIPAAKLSRLFQPLVDAGMKMEDNRKRSFDSPIIEQYKVEQDEEWNNLVQERCARYALSPTGTHNWQECQNRFFITQLIKVPGLGSEATAFGNIMHEVLKLIGKSPQVQGDAVWIEQTINRLFKSYWFRFFPIHLDAYRRYALWLLPRYLAMSPLPEQAGMIEKSFQQVSPSGLRIKGILDRVEIREGIVRMTDYKTGRRKDSMDPFQDDENPGSAYWRQGMIYAGIMQTMFPESNAFEFAFHYLEDDNPVEVLDVQPHEGLNNWLQSVWTAIISLRLRKKCPDPECIYCKTMAAL